MKKLIIISLILILSGCSTFKPNKKHPYARNRLPEYYEIDPVEFEEPQNETLEIIDNATLQDNFVDRLGDGSYDIATLVVLINFNDLQVQYTEAEYYNHYFGDTHSVASFFHSVSKNYFHMYPAMESYGQQNDGIISIDVDMNRPDLDTLQSNHVLDELLDAIINQIDSYIDVSLFDVTNDSIVVSTELNMQFILAGYEVNNPGTSRDEYITHPFYITLYESKQMDDTEVNSFVFLADKVYDSTNNIDLMEPISVIAHETGHVLGLPDLYDTDYSSYGTGIHALMSGGVPYNEDDSIAITPTNFSAWSKVQLGYVKPLLVEESGTYELFPESANNHNILRVDTNNPSIHYLLEYIQFTSYNRILDVVIKQEGVAVWKIDERFINYRILDSFISYDAVNDDDENQGIKLIEANSYALGYSELDQKRNPYRRPYDHYFSYNGYDHYFDYNQNIGFYFSEPTDSILVKIVFDDPLIKEEEK